MASPAASRPSPDDLRKNVGSKIKEKSEEKIRSKDYIGARTVIQDALNNLPELEHGAEMFVVCDILCTAEIELPNCGIDWYWVLQLFPSVEVAEIEARHKELVSQLISIKDIFFGTDLALGFAEEAFSVLSNPIKRAKFDSQRVSIADSTVETNSKFLCSEIPSSSGTKRPVHEDIGAPSEDNGRVSEESKRICMQEPSCASGKLSAQSLDGFKISLKFSPEDPCHRQSVANSCSDFDFYDFGKDRKPGLFAVGQVWALYDKERLPRCYARINKIAPDRSHLYLTCFKPCPESAIERSWCSAGFPVACGSLELDLFENATREFLIFSHKLPGVVSRNSFEIFPRRGEVWAVYKDWDIKWCSKPEMRKGCAFEVVECLTDYKKDSGTKVAYLASVGGFRNVFQKCKRRERVNNLLMFSHNVPCYRFIGEEVLGVSGGMLELDPLAVPESLVRDYSCDTAALEMEDLNCSDEASGTHHPSTGTSENGGLNVRIQQRKSRVSIKDFAANQVWAVYDGPDALPRTYAKVTETNSQDEVRVHVTLLEPHPMTDKEINWVEEDLPLVCGIFRASSTSHNLEVSQFSHHVKYDWSAKKSFYRIFPRKGEVWAMYKNWHSGWRNSDVTGCQFWIVEILTDFNDDDAGVSVCCLTEVPGRLTFFQKQQQEGFQLTRQLSRSEMLCFSHRIPAFTVLGIKDPSIPKGSWHLEPYALPPKRVKLEGC